MLLTIIAHYCGQMFTLMCTSLLYHAVVVNSRWHAFVAELTIGTAFTRVPSQNNHRRVGNDINAVIYYLTGSSKKKLS